MCHCAQTQRSSPSEGARERFGRKADFARVEPNRHDPIQPRLRRGQRRIGRLDREMAQERQDQAARDAVQALALGEPIEDAADHFADRNAALGVRLGIEERLDVANAVGVGSCQIRPGQVEEVLARDEHGAGRVVDVEERLQIAELVRRPDLLERAERQSDAVPGGQMKGQLRFERALQVDMQLDLGQAVDQVGELRIERARGVRKHVAHYLLGRPATRGGGMGGTSRRAGTVARELWASLPSRPQESGTSGRTRARWELGQVG